MRTISLQVLFVLKLLCLASLTEGQPKASLKCSKECSRFTSRIHEQWIKSYHRTEPQCFKQGIIFTTQKNRELCANPGEDWVKKIMQKLDQKKASVTSPLPRAATSAAVPEDPGIFHKQVGHRVTTPSQATAPTSTSKGAGTPILDGRNAPTLKTEVSSKPTQATLTAQVPIASSPVIWDIGAHSEMSSEAKSDSTKATAPSTTFATSTGPNQSMAPVQGFENSVGAVEGHTEYTTNATAQVPDMTSPILNSDPVSVTKALDHSVGSTDGSLGPTSARANMSDAASRSFHSHLPSILGNTEIITALTSPFAEDTSVSSLNPRADSNDPPNKIFRSWTDALGITTPEHSSGKQDFPDTPISTSQTFSGQVRARLTTEKNAPPFPSFLSRFQMHFVIPVCVAGGVIACGTAALWLYKKSGLKKAAMPMETVEGLLYHRETSQVTISPVEVI